MRLLVDAQLPVRLAEHFASLGHDVMHTSDLADGNRTTDAEIVRVADEADRIVVSKDRDFLDGHLLRGEPARLLVVSTGNIRNSELIALFVAVDDLLIDAFGGSVLVEVTRDAVISH